MPIYEYRCENDHTFEVVQSMSDDPVATCEVCGEPVQRVFHPVAVHFKGSGFYSTDYGKKRSGTTDSGSSGESKEGESKEGESKDSSSSSDEKQGGSSGESKGESKQSDAKSDSD